ncbi:MAG: Bax inhibitor-1/YccA family protein [Muribaculaceae bacterium]|nr:Bax inhibitor-1/YccA family protein [Muribaculaceae bacterium]
MSTYPPQFNQQAYDYATHASTSSRISLIMKRVYANMTLALIVTAFISLFCSNSEAYLTFMVQNSWFQWVLVIALFGIVIGVSAGINKLSTATALLLFYAFSAVMGMWLSPIFVVYTGASITKTFFITAGTFAGMSVYGFCTNRDLSRIGNFLIMALWGLIIASLVNIFTKSDTLSWIISIVGVFIFIGLTAWDTQQIKRLAAIAPSDTVGRLAVLGALNLYMDFINLFLFLLRFFGASRD